jgi:uncharacterized protein with FMN-binding domain
MASLARRLAPAAALGGLALVIVGVADPALAGHSESTATGTTTASGASSPAASSATCDNGQAVTGQSVMTRWGPVQVAGTVSNGKLCEVHAVVWPSGDGRSIQINDYAIPQLDAQAAQSGTQFDGVSGATYTTEGYRQSLQSILDSL